MHLNCNLSVHVPPSVSPSLPYSFDIKSVLQLFLEAFKHKRDVSCFIWDVWITAD